MLPLWIASIALTPLRWARTLWQLAPWPARAAFLVVAALALGYWRGLARGDAKCEARITASIEAAQSRDVEIARGAQARAEQQAREAEARASAVHEEVKSYAQEVGQRAGEACRAGLDADRINDGLGVQDDGVQPARPVPSIGRSGGANPGPVPKGSGKR